MTDTRSLAIFGAGGFLLQVLPMLDAARAEGRNVVVVDDRNVPAIFGYPVVALDDTPPDALFVVAVANGVSRAHITERLGERPLTRLTAATALASPHATIGPGAIVCDHVIVEAGCRIGKHFHANIFSYVAHECIVGDHVTFAPRVSCNGNVQIGDRAYIGTGAVIRQGTPGKPLRIGADAVIGMGAVVTKDVPDGATVVGNPARPR